MVSGGGDLAASRHDDLQAGEVTTLNLTIRHLVQGHGHFQCSGSGSDWIRAYLALLDLDRDQATLNLIRIWKNSDNFNEFFQPFELFSNFFMSVEAVYNHQKKDMYIKNWKKFQRISLFFYVMKNPGSRSGSNYCQQSWIRILIRI